MEVALRRVSGSRLKVQRRLRSLAAGELINIPLQGAVWFVVIGLPTTLPNLAGYCLFAAMLVVGAAYWLSKLHQVRSGRRDLPGTRVFRVAGVITPSVLAIGVTVTVYAVATQPARASWPGLGFALFAVLEYVNYYHLQLMHDTAADLRRGPCVKDCRISVRSPCACSSYSQCANGTSSPPNTSHPAARPARHFSSCRGRWYGLGRLLRLGW